MEKIPVCVKDSALFRGIASEDMASLLHCLSARIKSYDKGAIILHRGGAAGPVGVVCAGAVQIRTEDFMGNRTILTAVSPGDLFGEAFACTGVTNLPVSAVAVEKSQVLFIDYRKIVTTCPTTCTFHARLVENMMGVLAQKNILLNEKMEILSKRTTREKLIAFLSAQAQAAGSDSFTIPFNRQELADYLCVERSAMTTALGRLKQEGLVDFDRSHFVLKVADE